MSEAPSSETWIEARASDRHHWRARVYDDGAPAAAVVLLAAMGVRASFYQPFASQLSSLGYAVVTSDLRGHGESSLRASRAVDFGYFEICERDLPALVSAVRARYPSIPLFLAGHSLGGQVATLFSAAAPDGLAGLVLISSGSPHASNFSGLFRAIAWGLGWLAPALGRVLGHYPGQLLKFGSREARTVMADWGHAVGTGHFAPKHSQIDYETLLRSSPVPTVAFSFADDNWCPPEAVLDLTRRLESAVVEHHHLTSSETDGLSYDHFRWARNPAPLVRVLAPWLAQRSGRP